MYAARNDCIPEKACVVVLALEGPRSVSDPSDKGGDDPENSSPAWVPRSGPSRLFPVFRDIVTIVTARIDRQH